MSPWIRQIEQALAELRTLVPEPTTEDREQERRYAELLAELSATMAPAHIARLNALIDADADERPNADAGATRLWAVADELIQAALHGLTNFKLALPRAVGAVYLAGPGSHPYSQCRGCALVLPLGPDHHAEAQAVETCPECGGGIGRWDKWGGGPTLPTPAEKRAAFAAMEAERGTSAPLLWH